VVHVFGNKSITNVDIFCEVAGNFTDTVIVRSTEQKGGDYIMKKNLLVISMMFALAIAVGGCATKGDLEQVQTRENMIGAKADQAAQDAQAAKAAADAATLKANEAAARADEAVKRAEERERIADEKARIADEKAKQAETVFQKSMKK
jgi:murein lipoprotein